MREYRGCLKRRIGTFPRPYRFARGYVCGGGCVWRVCVEELCVEGVCVEGVWRRVCVEGV